MENHVVHLEVAVKDSGLLVGRYATWQCLDQAVHRIDLFDFRGAILAREAIELAREKVSRLAVISQSQGFVVHPVQARRGGIDSVVGSGALGGTRTGHLRVWILAALD